MKIEQLTLENFKCFKSEKTFDFSRLTILTGANSSGKSSVIHAILAVLQSSDFPNHLSINGDYINLGDFKEISNSGKRDNIIKLKLHVSRFYDDDSFIYYNTEWKEDKIDFLPTLSDGTDGLGSSNKKPTSNREKPVFHEITSNKPYYNLLILKKISNYISAFRKAPQRTYYEQNQQSYKVGTEGEEYIDQIVEWEKRSKGKMKDLVKTMKDLDLIEDIKINRLGGGRFELLVKPINSNQLSALSDVGSSVSAFMPIIVADLQLPDDSTLFVAEPEIHLHPSIQSKFGDYIVNNINNTYVIETHSEYFLNKIRLAIVKGELKKEDVKVYFLENNGDDTDVYDIDFTKTGAIKNAPPNFFRTYFLDTMDIALNSFAE
jgi:predicted ATPase